MNDRVSTGVRQIRPGAEGRGIFPIPRLARSAIVLSNVIVVTLFLSPWGPSWLAAHGIDLDVFRTSANAWLHGEGLYEPMRTESGLLLPFLYPPFSAVLMTPLTLLPLSVDIVIVTVVGIALTALVLWLFVRELGFRLTPLWIVAALLPVALLLEPVRETLVFGQVNVILMALVALDCLARNPRWPRGLLVGLGVAVKLTPAVFVLFFLLRKDFRAAAVAALTFVTTVVLGFVLAGEDSVRFWTRSVFQTADRISAHYAGNQSVLAVLSRLGLDQATPLWALSCVLVVGLAAVAMRQALAGSRTAMALALNSFVALLLAPISWSQHWVWGLPAVLVLVVEGWRAMALLPSSLGAIGFALFAVSPHWLLPFAADRELHWSALQHVVGSSYVFFGLAVLTATSSVVMWRSSSARARTMSTASPYLSGNRLGRLRGSSCVRPHDEAPIVDEGK